MNRKQKLKVRDMMNGKTLINQRGDTVHFDEDVGEFLITFESGATAMFEFKYISQFTTIKGKR